MKNKLSPLSLLNPAKLKVLLSLGIKGYLADKGWFDAYRTKSAIDQDGKPIAWVTYSFIDFIKDRINKEHDIFEFGSGNSTIFYAGLAKSVYSVEHDKEWFEKSSEIRLPNVNMIHCDLTPGGDYSKSAGITGRKFHMIIVDGRDRVNCCKQAIHSLTENGVVVLDDSERTEYAEAHDFFKKNGFKYLPFSGIAPGVIISKYTSIFYKPDNCLDI
ncbi:FkbM family methyltransferase [Pedobacter ginsengisoli]|uniref:FkbM family methyltransferase n=1 Tax=Pedobacter ginsengisoli TaxID=363852 RepID=UPI002550C881|nr:FkbM family methyltransferase [Pedobacter ginsengisoli]